MPHRKQSRAAAPAAVVPPPAGGRPAKMQNSRAGLASRLARDPIVLKSVGLVR